MTTTVLPELAAESAATAERLVGLSGQAGLGSAEAEYILASGMAAVERVVSLWPIIQKRIGGGMMSSTARQLLISFLEAVDRNLSLVATLKEPARLVREELGREPEAADALTAAETRLGEVRREVTCLLAVVDAPARWPTAEQLRESKERMQRGERISGEEFCQTS